MILDIIKKRRSIRAFQKKAVSQEIIDALIEAALWAPSAGNLQARKFYFVFNEDTKYKLADAAYGQSFVAEAPLAIVCCADLAIERHYGRRGEGLYCLQDVSASIQNMMLVACESGLGSVWVGAFDEDKASKLLKLPSHLRPVAIIPIGYPDERPSAPERVSKQEAVEFIL